MGGIDFRFFTKLGKIKAMGDGRTWIYGKCRDISNGGINIKKRSSDVYYCRYTLFFAFLLMLFPLDRGLATNAKQIKGDTGDNRKVITDASYITLNSWITLPPLSNSSDTGIIDLVIKEAFKRIGIIDVSIENLPAERSLINANKGLTGGEFIRIAGLDNVYPNLIQVPEKIIDFEFVGFSKNIDIKTTGWESLKPYSIGIITGWKILENNVVGTAHRTDVEDPCQLFRLLSLDRAGIVIFEKLEGIGMIKTLGLQGIKILEPPLAKKEMFLYLHKKHKKLVPMVAAALKEMKNDGTYENILKEGLSGYL